MQRGGFVVYGLCWHWHSKKFLKTPLAPWGKATVHIVLDTSSHHICCDTRSLVFDALAREKDVEYAVETHSKHIRFQFEV